MLREEAIEILEERWRYSKTYKYTDAEIREAFDMAIKAIEEVSRLPENLHREREQAYMNGYADGRNTMRIKESAYDDAVERIEKSTFTLHDGLDCVETLVALEAVMIASAQTKPCKEQYSVDCVSRDAVLKLADYFGEPATYDNPMPDGIMAVPVDKIEELPSVIPTNPSTTPSVGVWIDQGSYADNSSAHDFMCSVCGNNEIEVEMDHFKHCPVCGARMEADDNDIR